MSGYCSNCGNAICICDLINKEIVHPELNNNIILIRNEDKHLLGLNEALEEIMAYVQSRVYTGIMDYLFDEGKYCERVQVYVSSASHFEGQDATHIKVVVEDRGVAMMEIAALTRYNIDKKIDAVVELFKEGFKDGSK